MFGTFDELLFDLRLHHISADTIIQVLFQIPVSMCLTFYVGREPIIQILRTSIDMYRLKCRGMETIFYKTSLEDDLDLMTYDLALTLCEFGNERLEMVVENYIEE